MIDMGWFSVKFFIFAYYTVMNMVGFLVMLFDKRKAMYHKRRTKESSIFIISLLGGALGVFLAMHMFRHKTRHNSFVYGIPAILIVHILLISYLLYNYPNIFN